MQFSNFKSDIYNTTKSHKDVLFKIVFPLGRATNPMEKHDSNRGRLVLEVTDHNNCPTHPARLPCVRLLNTLQRCQHDS